MSSRGNKIPDCGAASGVGVVGGRAQAVDSPTEQLHYISSLTENKINNPAAIKSASKIPSTTEITQCPRVSLIRFDLATSCAAPIPIQKGSLLAMGDTSRLAFGYWNSAPDNQADRAI